jgi:hypothetical protein
VNGSIDTTAHWDGGPVTINVDGINASITEYQLTVYDRIGYSVSDIVTLNVTEYIKPGPIIDGIYTLGLIIIVASIAIVVIIIVIVKKKK